MKVPGGGRLLYPALPHALRNGEASSIAVLQLTLPAAFGKAVKAWTLRELGAKSDTQVEITVSLLNKQCRHQLMTRIIDRLRDRGTKLACGTSDFTSR